MLVTKALTTFEGTCLSLDPEIKIVEQLRIFVRKHIARVPAFNDILEQMRSAPFEMERLQRLVVKHGARVVGFFENPVVRLEGRGPGVAAGQDRDGMNTAYGLIIAALILFAAFLGNGSALEQWLRSFLLLPDIPVLSLTSLALAGLLWLGLCLRNRPRRKDDAKTT